MNRDEMRRLIETHREAEAVGDLDAVLATFADDCFLGIGGIADGLDPLERRLRPQRAFDAVLHEQCLCDLVPQRRVRPPYLQETLVEGQRVLQQVPAQVLGVRDPVRAATTKSYPWRSA